MIWPKSMLVTAGRPMPRDVQAEVACPAHSCGKPPRIVCKLRVPAGDIARPVEDCGYPPFALGLPPEYLAHASLFMAEYKKLESPIGGESVNSFTLPVVSFRL
jgi:hypothetical protein